MAKGEGQSILFHGQEGQKSIEMMNGEQTDSITPTLLAQYPQQKTQVTYLTSRMTHIVV